MGGESRPIYTMLTDKEREYITNLALKLQGTPYLWGGSNPHYGFDCSGFVIWILQVFFILPAGDWKASDFSKVFKETKTPQPGDLVLYGAPTITHITMYIGNGMQIGASGGNSSTLTEAQAKAQNAKVKIKSVRYRNDFVCYLSIDERV